MDVKALYNIGYGLYLLSARDGDKNNGCIVNTLMQITSDPATAVIAVNKENLTHDLILKTGRFNISMLTTEAPFELFRQFGFQSGRTTDKFAGYTAVVRAQNGIYYLNRYTNAYASFEVTGTADCGTHTLFYARITDAVTLSDAESLTYSYYQSHIKPAPKPVTKTVWRCVICGYEYEGDELPPDFVCPICKHGAADFIKINAEEKKETV